MRVYEKRWCKADGTDLIIPPNQQVLCFALPFTHEMRITKLIVKQSAGVNTGFTVDVFNAAIGPFLEDTYMYGDEYSSYSVSVDTVTESLAKVIPSQTATSGNAVELITSSGYAFKNMEGTLTVPVKLIYVRITTTSNNSTSWDLAIGGFPEGARQA